MASSQGEILANVNSQYIPRGGGIHPREAAQTHTRNAVKTVLAALREAGIGLSSVDVVAFSQGPGLGPCLRTGATVARTLSLALGKPLVGVNHGIAHIEVGKLVTRCRDPLVLYVAGGNTLITCLVERRYRILGETLDIAAGNCLDAFGISAGIGPMPAPENLSESGSTLYPLPYRVKGMDISLSGVLTACEKLLLSGARLEDVCLSITETVYSMLTEVVERALAYTGKSSLLIVGGLARSRRLREMLECMCSERGVTVYTVPPELAGDNGAMIAWTGLLHFMSGYRTPVNESHVRPRMRIDEVEVGWSS